MRNRVRSTIKLQDELAILHEKIGRLEKAGIEYAKTEEALRASRLQLAEAMDIARIVYWEMDIDRDVLIFNDSFYAFYGTTAEKEGGYEMYWQDYAERFVHPDDLPLFYGYAEQNRARQEEDLSDVEHRIVRRDGITRHILARVRYVKDESGAVVKVFGANQDITDRKLAELALRESESRFKGYFEASAIGMAIVALNGEWIRVNRSLCLSLGYSMEELRTMTFREIAYPDDAEKDSGHLRKLLNNDIAYYHIEKRYIHRDGHIVWGKLSVSLVRDAFDRPLYLICQVQDITEHKLLEQKLQAVSITDELTGLYNRRGFVQLCRQEMLLASRTNETLLLFYADLDNMKKINDTMGHQEGDSALVAVAGMLRDTFRKSDIIGRIGGDEFAILAAGVVENTEEVLMERLQERIDRYNEMNDRHDLPISITVGTTRCLPDQRLTLEDLLTRADACMYELKRAKRNAPGSS